MQMIKDRCNKHYGRKVQTAVLFQLIFLFFLLFGLEQTLTAQSKTAFSGDAVVYISELKTFFASLSNPKDKQAVEILLNDFNKNWDNSINPVLKSRIALLNAGLFQQKIKSHGHIFSYLQTILLLSKSNQPDNEQLDNWLRYAERLLELKSVDDTEHLLKATDEWLKMQKIGGKGTVSWFLRAAQWQFSFENDTLYLKASGNLVGATRRDSTVIENTQGVLIFGRNSWKGKDGYLFWRKSGNMNKANARFSDYSIQLEASGFRADSVLLRHPDYFPWPVLGALEEQVFNSPPGDKMAYPSFKSYLDDYEVDGLFPNLRYKGAIILEGNAFVGKGLNGNQASVSFLRAGKTMLIVRADYFLIGSDRIQSEKGEVSIYLEQDSVYHPGLWFRYNNDKNYITLLRSVKGIPDGPFFDSYHQVNIFADACYWDTGKDDVFFQQALGLQTQNTASAESASFFSRADYEQLMGIDAENPVAALARYKKENGIESEVKLGFLSAYLKKPPEQVAAQLMKLAAKGYLVYNAKSETALLGSRFDAVAGARAGTHDFDVIRFNSVTKSAEPNIVLKLQSRDLVINGIAEVVLSETQGVQLFPDEKTIVLKKNRDFTFSGLVKAGLFDFYAKTATFGYDAFKLQFASIDSIAFMVPDRDQPSAEAKVKRKYVKVRNVLADLTGTLSIDERFNKSGTKNLPRFPVFTSNNESYVYFDDEGIQHGALKRKSFYYVVDPFEIDSLDNFVTDNLRFEGYLASGGIFPTFREPLVVMKDYSLGFEHKLPRDGYPMFDGLARYFDNIKLSNLGFEGLGRIDYLTTSAWSKQFFFTPDSVNGRAEKYLMKEQTATVSFPKGEGAMLKLDWQIDSNVMVMTTDTIPYKLFESSKLLGVFSVSPKEMTANGVLSFDDAVVASRYFALKSRSFVADTADFRLLAQGSDRPAFLANDYFTRIDFDSKTGFFNHIHSKSSLSFPFNLYVCALDEAYWDMSRQTISLNNNSFSTRYDFSGMTNKEIIKLNLSGSLFTSVHPEQDSLSFFCLRADYDLTNYRILAKDVKIIRVGDAAVFPSDSIVSIAKNAEILPLKNAVIVADTVSMTHVFTNANVRLFSRKKMAASGNYSYRDVQGQTTDIRFEKIENDATGHTIARASLKDEDAFYLNPWFRFAGNVHLNTSQKLLRFEGGYKIVHQCNEDALPYVSFDTLVDPMDVILPVLAKNTDNNGLPVRNGFYFAPFSDSYYAAFLQTPRAASDKLLAAQSGQLRYHIAGSRYLIQDRANDKEADFVEFYTEKCIVNGRASIPLDLNMTMVELETTGAYSYKMIPDSTYLDVLLSLNFPFDDKLLGMMADSINGKSLPGSDGLDAFYLPALKKKLASNDFEKIANEVSLYGAPRKVPDKLIKSLVFSQLKLKWNPSTRSFVSQGSIQLANIGKTQINKKLEGFVELEKSRSGDAFTVYLMLNSKEWYFFSFKNGVMQSLSSSNTFNSALMEIKPEKRVINDPEKGGRYEFTLATKRKMVDFLRKMQNIE